MCANVITNNTVHINHILITENLHENQTIKNLNNLKLTRHYGWIRYELSTVDCIQLKLCSYQKLDGCPKSSDCCVPY